jgi:UDP-N-acetylglucosamine--N-acetylmuramyl-(pentapeptide) pyrophosphoryl-undecaprenol N-acetylglucosamine transferase
MIAALPELAAAGSALRITHQTGDADVEMVRAAYRAAALTAEVEPFLYDMGRRLAGSDIVVCRAGATTLAEVAAAGKAAIVVPLPTSTDDHQRRNAEALAAAGAAEVLLQPAMSGHALASRILSLAQERDRRMKMAACARATAKRDAAAIIVSRALDLAEGRAA